MAEQVQLHKSRNESSYLESAWVASKDHLPLPRYAWTASTPLVGASKIITASHRFRKVGSQASPLYPTLAGCQKRR